MVVAPWSQVSTPVATSREPNKNVTRNFKPSLKPQDRACYFCLRIRIHIYIKQDVNVFAHSVGTSLSAHWKHGFHPGRNYFNPKWIFPPVKEAILRKQNWLAICTYRYRCAYTLLKMKRLFLTILICYGPYISHGVPNIEVFWPLLRVFLATCRAEALGRCQSYWFCLYNEIKKQKIISSQESTTSLVL